MLIKKFRKLRALDLLRTAPGEYLLPVVYCLLSAVLFFPVYTAAGGPGILSREAAIAEPGLVLQLKATQTKGLGWLLWEAPAYIHAPAGEKEIRSADMGFESMPLTASLEGEPDTRLELDAIFEAGADDLRVFFDGAGFEETPYEFKKAFSEALTQLFSARFPSKFPPAPKWLAGGQPQNLSFIRLQNGCRQGAYFWRLPFRTKKAPLWAAGLGSPDGECGRPRPFWTKLPPEGISVKPSDSASRPKERGWALLPEKTKKSRALDIRARRTGKPCFIFTLP